MQKAQKITNVLTDESEYRKMLNFCMEYDLYCFEYHYRHRARKANWKKAKGGVMG